VGPPAAARWRALGYDDRKQRLVAYRGYLARRMHELAELVHRENGKPHADAILEITLAIDHLARAGNHARKVLGSHRVPAGMLAAGNAVVLKPAEHPATIGAWLAAAWRAAVPDAADAFQVVTGFGGTGSALRRAGVDKLACTGSASTGSSPRSWSSAARRR
jgi:acyl-CoA reductase-like NAD-dependent aldehyde dehydrogenase